MTLPCPVCHYDGTFPTLFLLAIGRVRQCADCSLVSLIDPGTENFAECSYDEAYYARGEASSSGYVDYVGREAEIRTQTAAAAARYLSTYLDRGDRALDVGCGAGYLVQALHEAGWRASGIDTSPAVIELAQQRGVQSVSTDALTSAALGPAYDLITLFDVIEHVDDPSGLLRNAFARLGVGGALVLVTPRYGGWLSRAQGAAYVQFKLDHKHYFSEASLVRCAEEAGADAWQLLPYYELLRQGGANDAVLKKYAEERDSLALLAERLI